MQELVWIVMMVAGMAFPAAARAVDVEGAPPDNSKTNQRDNGTVAPSAEQQGSGTADIEITRRIRSALTDDRYLSSYSQNVKIITRNGDVLLKGPVPSMEEKLAVERAAIKVAGKNHVKDELEITAK